MKFCTTLLFSIVTCILCFRAFGQTPEDGTNITHMPLVGDETAVSALVASPREYLGQAVIICGFVKVTDFYSNGYYEASPTHFSFRFDEATKEVKPTRERLDVYGRRDMCGPFVDHILRNQKAGDLTAVRLKVRITSRSFFEQKFLDSAELVDWQFLKHDYKWEPWTIESADAATRELQYKKAQEIQAQRSSALALQTKVRKQKLFDHYTAEANAGDGFAQLELGKIFLHGDGVETNLALARKWLSIALTNGSPDAAGLLSEIERNHGRQ